METYSTTETITQTSIEAPTPIIKVIGLGGGGCNAINRMIEFGMKGVEFIACNTDKQALNSSLAEINIQLGPECTRGLGAGGHPEIGEKAAEESFQVIADALDGANMVFLAAGLGGGTGTGSIPVAARVSKTIGAVTIAVVTTPFSFEMGHRQKNALFGLDKLKYFTDTLITIPNDRLLEVAPQDLPLEMAFRLADDVLRQGVAGVSELITENGLINVDFAHIRHVMELGGGAMMAVGTGEGQNKTMKALEQALHHPLLEEINLKDAAGIIANFSGGDDLTFAEVTETLLHLHQSANEQVEIIPGVINNPLLSDRAQVILIVTGLGALPIDQVLPGAEKWISELEVEKSLQNTKQSTQPVQISDDNDPSNHAARRRQQKLHPSIVSADLDLPAFLRKRISG